VFAVGNAFRAAHTRGVPKERKFRISKLRCFSIQKASAEGFGSIGNPKLHPLRDLEVAQSVAIWKSAVSSQEPMILKIAQIRDLHKVRLRLSGEFRSHHLDQVKATISRGEPTVLDLEEVDLVDIEAIRFLNAREDEGISVLHCSPYIQEWMSRERQEEKARTDWR
jgi:hypothetical protein